MSMRFAKLFAASTLSVTAVTSLLIYRKVQRIMAQLDDLNTAIDGISGKLDTLKADVENVLTELQVANQNPAVDLTATIAKVQAISAKLDGITAEFPTATPTANEMPTA